MEVIDGSSFLHACSLGLKACSDESPCPIHNDVKIFKEKLKKVFHEKTVQQLAKEMERGTSHVKLFVPKRRT